MSYVYRDVEVSCVDRYGVRKYGTLRLDIEGDEVRAGQVQVRVYAGKEWMVGVSRCTMHATYSSRLCDQHTSP